MSIVRVLIVEDTALLAEHFARQLRHAGYETRVARHVYEALDLVDDFMPDVITLDMLLGGVNAMALLHELQSHEDIARIPIVMVTQLASELTLDTVRPYGVCALLDKTTMQPEDLVSAVEAAI